MPRFLGATHWTSGRGCPDRLDATRGPTGPAWTGHNADTCPARAVGLVRGAHRRGPDLLSQPYRADPEPRRQPRVGHRRGPTGRSRRRCSRAVSGSHDRAHSHRSSQVADARPFHARRHRLNVGSPSRLAEHLAPPLGAAGTLAGGSPKSTESPLRRLRARTPGRAGRLLAPTPRMAAIGGRGQSVAPHRHTRGAGSPTCDDVPSPYAAHCRDRRPRGPCSDRA